MSYRFRRILLTSGATAIATVTGFALRSLAQDSSAIRYGLDTVGPNDREVNALGARNTSRAFLLGRYYTVGSTRIACVMAISMTSATMRSCQGTT